MSDEKKQGDENWRKFTADDLTAALDGRPTSIRYRDTKNKEWKTGTEKYIQKMWKRSQCKYFMHVNPSGYSVLPWMKFDCQVYVEPAPTRSPKDGCRMLEDNEEPIPGDFINWGAGWNELGEGSFPLAVAIPSWYCRPIKEPISKFDRPVPKGFRLLGDEPRLASDGYWSLSCKDWLVIGDRVEEANRDKWPAIRLEWPAIRLDAPEPVKHQSQIQVKHPGQANSPGLIMQIRLPVPASVLGKLGDMLEKHYPGSTMRQVGGYLVFEEPIES
jgi:hypothetical protein